MGQTLINLAMIPYALIWILIANCFVDYNTPQYTRNIIHLIGVILLIVQALMFLIGISLIN